MYGIVTGGCHDSGLRILMIVASILCHDALLKHDLLRRHNEYFYIYGLTMLESWIMKSRK